MPPIFIAVKIESGCQMNPVGTGIKILKYAIIFLSLILWGRFSLILLASLPSTGTLPGLLFDFIVVSIQNGSILILLALICFSISYLMYCMNYEFELIMEGTASVCYIFLVLILLFSGIQMISMDSPPVHMVNTTYSAALHTQAREDLGSGMFGEGIGLIGIAAAVFGLLLRSHDKIQSSIKYKTLIRYYQFENLAFGWLIVALLIAVGLTLHDSGTVQILPDLYPITLMLGGLVIEIVGLLLLGGGYFKYKDKERDSFHEKIQKAVINMNQK
jgi:hypothetical protein